MYGIEPVLFFIEAQIRRIHLVLRNLAQLPLTVFNLIHTDSFSSKLTNKSKNTNQT